MEKQPRERQTAGIYDENEHPFSLLSHIVVDYYHLSPTEMALYVVLLRFANCVSREAWPSLDTLAERADMSRSSVIRTLPKLEAKKLIEIEHTTRGNVYRLLNVYRVDPSVPETPPSIRETPVSVTETLEQAPIASVSEAPVGVPETPPSVKETPVSVTETPVSVSVTPKQESVVVVDSNQTESPPEQQQQEPPRAVTEAEQAVFREMKIAASIWSPWMSHPPEHVLACVLHAQAEGDRPVGLLRTMLEKGKGAPARKYIEQAERRLRGEPEPDPEEADGGKYIQGPLAAFIEH